MSLGIFLGRGGDWIVCGSGHFPLEVGCDSILREFYAGGRGVGDSHSFHTPPHTATPSPPQIAFFKSISALQKKKAIALTLQIEGQNCGTPSRFGDPVFLPLQFGGPEFELALQI
jgi:hypothetical protein